MNSLLITSLSTALFVAFLSYMVVLSKLISLKKSMAKLFIDKYALEEYIRLLQDKKEDRTEDQIHKENFLKFLSDSRDWAFTYIEDVQNGLEKFINDVKPEMEYFEEYGIVGSSFPHYHSMKKILESYNELKKLMPEESEKIQ